MFIITSERPKLNTPNMEKVYLLQSDVMAYTESIYSRCWGMDVHDYRLKKFKTDTEAMKFANKYLISEVRIINVESER